MPIEVACACGKRLKAPDHAAGKRAKCPGCGAAVTVPAAGEPKADDLYDLIAPPAEPATKPAPAPRAAPAETASGRPEAAKPQGMMQSQYWQAAASRVAQRDAAAEQGPKRLFNVAGIDVTPVKLAMCCITLLVVLGVPTWFFKFGPGAQARLLGTQTVRVLPLLEGLTVEEPYSLFSGTGNMSLGIKAPKLKNPPGGAAAATVDELYALGGDDRLYLAQPDRDGDKLLVEAQVSFGLIQHSGRLSQYKLHVNAADFTLVPAGGAAPIPAQLLTAEFGSRVEIETGASKAISHESLLPAGVKPTSQDLEGGFGGAASGTIRFDGSGGVKGEFTFSSPRFASGQPGTSGIFADGKVTRTAPDGAAVEYAYNGGTVEVSWPQGVGRAGYWAKNGFQKPDGMNPWEKVEVTLLFDRPPGDATCELKYVDHVVGTVKPASAAVAAAEATQQPAASAAAPPQPAAPVAAAHSAAAPPPQPAQAGSEPVEPVTGYLRVLADARDKARGVVGMSNMNQIGLAIGLYVQQNGDRMPESLEDLKAIMPAVDSLLLNPRTKEKPGFVYERPAEFFGQIPDPAKTPILWELKDGQKDPDGSVLYADGHIESRYIP